MMEGPAPSVTGRRMRFAPLLAAVLAIVLAGCGSTGAKSHTQSSESPESIVYRWGVVGNAGKIAQLELSTPEAIVGISGKVVQVATSNSDGYALNSAGEVFAWGVNSGGELGDGQKTPYEVNAVRVDFPSGVKIVSLPDPMPFDAGLAIDSTGHAWGWGINGSDDLCLSTLVETRPTELPLSNVTLATGARTHTLFVSNGALFACGSGDAGELGNGSTSSASTPTPVIGLPAGAKFTDLTSSWEGSGALLANGGYYNWGYNAAGQLGDGDTANRAVPVKVHLPGPVAEVFQGGSGAKNGQTIAILANGAVWTWGSNGRGQLGNGTTTNSDVPVQVHVPEGVNFTKVNSGGYASYAIDTTGRLWAWGDNRDGQLGTGSDDLRVTLPVVVGLHLSQVSSTAQNVAGLGP
jgi:alpha-tubulin suppressor-like RCC1 family protein